MRDAFVMRRRKSLRDLNSIIDGLPGGKRSLLQPLTERLSFQQLRNQVWCSVGLCTDVMNGEDVGMIQRSNRACFPLEAPQPVPVAANLADSTFTAT